MGKRVNRTEVSEIAMVRIERLMAMSREQASHGDIDLARRYVDIARRISMRTRTKIPKEHIYCKNCFTPMTPGTFRVRLGTHRIIMVCAECGTVKRIPYVKEQRR
ncbi:MAG: ribonuclease P protein component 4 [Methanomassiliicoccaceae archaeon]|jgi:ribonuclease P protein subunit RPR2|nr:ribonuclease P protein component 4 [Methanomassiliicoccaceae archaeon]